MLIKCKKCGSILVKDDIILDAIKHFDVNMNTYEVEAGIMCIRCGHYIPEKKIQEVLKSGNKY